MIHNLHILTQPDGPDPATQARAAQEQILIDAHRRGEHPFESMLRECPLCQLGK